MCAGADEFGEVADGVIFNVAAYGAVGGADGNYAAAILAAVIFGAAGLI